jgi:DNA-directed RNA polymerase subunit M/transcription elongation factor TFIIS
MPGIEDHALFRKNIKTKLTTIIGDEKTAINLEKGVFNFAIKEASARKIVKKWENSQFVQLYIDRMRSIYINLKNETLLNQLKSKEIPPQTFAFMTHQEFSPEHWKDYIDRKHKRDMSKYTNNVEASTDMFVCKKCKSRRCTYYELQVRSADEPTNVFITCLDCGKNWKQ